MTRWPLLFMVALMTARAGSSQNALVEKGERVEQMEKQWRAEHSRFVQGMLQRDACHPSYRHEIAELQKAMIVALGQKRDYYADWLSVITSRIEDQKQIAAKLRSQLARTQRDVVAREALLKDQRNRRAALSPHDADALQTLDKLIEAVEMETAVLHRQIVEYQQAAQEVERLGTDHAARMRALDAQTRSNSLTLENMWKDLYHKFSVRGQLICANRRN